MSTDQSRDAILAAMKGVLVPEGFQPHGSTFHRHRGEGFIDVVSLHAGRGVSQDKDTVSLGVYIPQVARFFNPALGRSLEAAKAHKRPRQSECDLRIRLPRLAYGEDRWFDRSRTSVGDEIAALLVSCGLPYFAEFSSLKVIADGVRSGRLPDMVVRPGVQAAVFFLLGERDAARSVLLKWHPDNPRMVENYARAIGIKL